MTQRGRAPTLIEFPSVGHAPMFSTPEQIESVREFLLLSFRAEGEESRSTS